MSSSNAQVNHIFYTYWLLVIVFIQLDADPPQASTALREESETGNTTFALLFRKVTV
jgi:hypothetical protein